MPRITYINIMVPALYKHINLALCSLEFTIRSQEFYCHMSWIGVKFKRQRIEQMVKIFLWWGNLGAAEYWNTFANGSTIVNFKCEMDRFLLIEDIRDRKQKLAYVVYYNFLIFAFSSHAVKELMDRSRK